jgi:hypothetical protein
MVRDGSLEYGKKPISKPEELAELGLKLLKNADRVFNFRHDEIFGQKRTKHFFHGFFLIIAPF